MFAKTLRTLSAALVAAAALAPSAHALWPDHVDQAHDWVFAPYINVNYNDYGQPASIWTDAAGDLHALTRCGSFTALLLKAAYPGVIDDAVLSALTGSNSPYADQWFTAIDTQKKDATSQIGFTKRTSMANLQEGDILAAKYPVGSDDTGHVMTVESVTLNGAGITLPSDRAVPGVATVDRYEVTVYDSTKEAHGKYASNPKWDSRYRRENLGVTYWITDSGIGRGTIVVYANPANGAIVSWAWNVSATTTSYYYSVTPPVGSTYPQREMVAGFLSGPGL
jgi:hypothetical protein